jgi:hypothetical protein
VFCEHQHKETRNLLRGLNTFLSVGALSIFRVGFEIIYKYKHRMLLSICEFSKNGIRDDRTFLLCKSQNVKFILEQDMKVQRGSRGIALLFLYP